MQGGDGGAVWPVGNGAGCGEMVGADKERVVLDEGSFGRNSGISKGPQQPHGRGLATHHPARPSHHPPTGQ